MHYQMGLKLQLVELQLMDGLQVKILKGVRRKRFL